MINDFNTFDFLNIGSTLYDICFRNFFVNRGDIDSYLIVEFMNKLNYILYLYFKKQNYHCKIMTFELICNFFCE
jgi:hypothetical protein